MKFLLLTLILAIVLVAFFGVGRRGRRRQDPPATPSPDAARRDATSTAVMVACARCGVHLPEADALQEGGRSYCSAAHKEAGARGAEAPHP